MDGLGAQSRIPCCRMRILIGIWRSSLLLSSFALAICMIYVYIRSGLTLREHEMDPAIRKVGKQYEGV